MFCENCVCNVYILACVFFTMKKSLVSNWLKSYLYFTEPIGNIIPFAPSTEKNIFIHDNVEILGEMLRKTSLAEENRISLVDLSDNPGGATASEKEEQVNNGTDSVFNYLVCKYSVFYILLRFSAYSVFNIFFRHISSTCSGLQEIINRV